VIEGVVEAHGGSDADVHRRPMDPEAGVWAIEEGRGGPHADVIGPDAGTVNVAPSFGGTVGVEGAPNGDFPTESPIEVPAPEF
jgi:hypothetical protein